MDKRPESNNLTKGMLSRLQEFGPTKLAVLGGIMLLSVAVLCVPFMNWSMVQPHKFKGDGLQQRGAEGTAPGRAIFQARTQESPKVLAAPPLPQQDAAPAEKTVSAASPAPRPMSQSGASSALPAGGIKTVGADERSAFKAKPGLDAHNGQGQNSTEISVPGAAPTAPSASGGAEKRSTLSSDAPTALRAPKLTAKAFGAATPIQASSLGSAGVRFGGVESSYGQGPKVEPSALERVSASISASGAGISDPQGSNAQGSNAQGSASAAASAAGGGGASSSGGGGGSSGGASGSGSGSDQGGLEDLTKRTNRCSEAQDRLQPKIDQANREYADLLARHGNNSCGKSCNQDWDQKCRYNQCTICETGFYCGDWVWREVCDEGRCRQVKECSNQYRKFCNCNSLWCDSLKKCAQVNSLNKELSGACNTAISPMDCNQ